MPFGHYVEISVPSSAFRKCQQAPGNLFTFHLLFENFYRRPQTAPHEAQVAFLHMDTTGRPVSCEKQWSESANSPYSTEHLLDSVLCCVTGSWYPLPEDSLYQHFPNKSALPRLCAPYCREKRVTVPGQGLNQSRLCKLGENNSEGQGKAKGVIPTQIS